MSNEQSKTETVEEFHERAQAFLDALGALVESGGGWEYEIEEQIKTLSSAALTDFVHAAGRACGLLGDMVGNILLNGKVKIPRAKKPAETETPATACHVIQFPVAEAEAHR